MGCLCDIFVTWDFVLSRKDVEVGCVWTHHALGGRGAGSPTCDKPPGQFIEMVLLRHRSETF